MSPGSAAEPPADCARCPRLAQYRAKVALEHPDWLNAPVPSFGATDGRLLVLGLAPGVSGANRTGRPFTGDYAGVLLYATLTRFGFANGRFAADPADGLELRDCLVSNAVRCVPPQNKPHAGRDRHLPVVPRRAARSPAPPAGGGLPRPDFPRNPAADPRGPARGPSLRPRGAAYDSGGAGDLRQLSLLALQHEHAAG